MVGRTTLVDTVPTGYGRPKGDAGACPVDETVTFRPAASWPGNVDVVQPSKEEGDGRRITGVACHIGSHSITCHPTQANTPRLNPARLVLDLPTPEGWKAKLT